MTTSLTHDSPRLAETYDRLSDSQLESGKRLVERLAIEPGHRVLDVGCGTGRLTRWIAERVGPTGRVVGIDPLAERVALARARAAEITFEVGQAEDLRAFPDESFDAVCLSAVFHWVTDKPKALSEIRRVLRPGGALGVTTLPRELSGTGTVAAVLRPVIGRAPYAEKVDLSPVSWASGGPTTTDILMMLIEGRLDLSELHVVSRSRTHATGDEVLDFLDASSFGNFLRIVPEELRASLRGELAAGFDARRGPSGVVVRDYGTVFVAKRPKHD